MGKDKKEPRKMGKKEGGKVSCKKNQWRKNGKGDSSLVRFSKNKKTGKEDWGKPEKEPKEK